MVSKYISGNFLKLAKAINFYCYYLLPKRILIWQKQQYFGQTLPIGRHLRQQQPVPRCQQDHLCTQRMKSRQVVRSQRDPLCTKLKKISTRVELPVGPC